MNGVFNAFFSVKGYAENRILVLGDRSSLMVENNAITIRNEQETILNGTVKDDDGGFIDEFEDFYHAIRQGQRVKSTFSESYRDLLVVIKALESASSRQTFHLNY